jgi:hypothetical protein
MTFNAQVFRVFIASSSDLTEERDAATDVINAWNAQHASAEGVVLLPVRWDTHARPQSGIRPQQAINNQLVSKCDILLGMFWTRVGTSTGIADSGTLEEIDRCPLLSALWTRAAHRVMSEKCHVWTGAPRARKCKLQIRSIKAAS